MAKKKKSKPGDVSRPARPERYAKPVWMKTLWIVSLVIISLLTLLAMTALVMHFIFHFE